VPWHLAISDAAIIAPADPRVNRGRQRRQRGVHLTLGARTG